jgi:hypothetical protein
MHYRSGRPRITSVQNDRAIHRLCVTHPTSSAGKIASQLHPHVPASISTVKRRLRDDFNLRAFRPAKKPSLSTKNIADRVHFCRQYRHWTANDWKKVLFSYETLVTQFAFYLPHVRRPQNQRYHERSTIPVVKHAPSVMFWGCLSASGPGALWVMPQGTSINSAVYLGIAQQHVPAKMDRLHCTHFLQDGAPCHSAKKGEGLV